MRIIFIFLLLLYKSYLNLGEASQVEEQGIPSEGDAVVSHNRSNYPILVLYVLHAPPNAVESQHKGLCPPEP